MPEGPSIILLKEESSKFTGEKIISVGGNTKVDKHRMVDQEIISFKSWGKHFLICFKDFTVRIHLLMFGSYRIDEERDRPARLNITFNNGMINFYSCSVRILEGNAGLHYDFSSDVMSDEWDPAKARKKLMKYPDELICDALLDQNIFSGVGNIIKNEVLYRVRIHPESLLGKIPVAKIRRLILESRSYSFEFLEWKRKYELKKHWLAHTKKICLRCNLPIIRKHTGTRNRRSFFCEKCQRLYISKS